MAGSSAPISIAPKSAMHSHARRIVGFLHGARGVAARMRAVVAVPDATATLPRHPPMVDCLARTSGKLQHATLTSALLIAWQQNGRAGAYATRRAGVGMKGAIVASRLRPATAGFSAQATRKCKSATELSARPRASQVTGSKVANALSNAALVRASATASLSSRLVTAAQCARPS